MPTYTYAFGGTPPGTNGIAGVNAIPGFGDRWKVGFAGTFAVGDLWRLLLTASTLGDLTIGAGPAIGIDPGLDLVGQTRLTPTVCFSYKNRVYLGLGAQFDFSENNDPTLYNEQNPGAGFVTYLSQFGGQDSVAALGQLQGRLAVFARRSVQIWTVDADPNNFANNQILDNIGTKAPLSVQQLGDFDILFLDDTGIRSLRSREVTLNAYVDDIGSSIDDFIQTALLSVDASTACAIVEPTTKNYWLYLNGNIYVLSRHPAAKISAWSQYKPTDQNGATFIPQKFVVHAGRVYIRDTTNHLYLYGGAANTTYDAQTVVTVQLPWLDDKKMDTVKMGMAVNCVSQGNWGLKVSMDPQSNNFVVVVPNRGSGTTPAALTDSTYDLGNYRVPGLKGTHFSLLWVSVPAAATQPAVLSSITFHYNDAGKA